MAQRKSFHEAGAKLARVGCCMEMQNSLFWKLLGSRGMSVRGTPIQRQLTPGVQHWAGREAAGTLRQPEKPPAEGG